MVLDLICMFLFSSFQVQDFFLQHFYHKLKNQHTMQSRFSDIKFSDCDLVTIFQRPFFNLLHKIIRFSDIMRFSDSFCGDPKCR